MRQTVPAGSIYGSTLQAITRQPTPEVLERLRLLDLSSISDEIAHEVFSKVKHGGRAQPADLAPGAQRYSYAYAAPVPTRAEAETIQNRACRDENN